MRHVAHWDDVERETTDLGTIAATEHWLSGGVGCHRLGASRIQVPAGRASTPQHAEDAEVFYILGGDGWSVQEDGCFAVGAGDVVHYTPWEPAHTVVAGDAGIEYIAMGTSEGPLGTTRFPRIDKVRVADHLLSGSHDHQWELEARLDRIEVKHPPDPRPATIVALADVPARPFGEGSARWCGRALGVRGLGLNVAELGPGQEGAPPHCHSMEEELFVVLDGDGVLTLGDEEHPVRAGSIVSRPPASRIAHAFRGGDAGLTLLMFSDKHGSDMVFYPRTGEVLIRGLGVRFSP